MNRNQLESPRAEASACDLKSFYVTLGVMEKAAMPIETHPMEGIPRDHAAAIY